VPNGVEEPALSLPKGPAFSPLDFYYELLRHRTSLPEKARHPGPEPRRRRTTPVFPYHTRMPEPCLKPHPSCTVMALTSATCKPVEAKDPTLQEFWPHSRSPSISPEEPSRPRHPLLSPRRPHRHEIGLDHAAVSDLYYASLLKDVGCSSNSALMCQIVGGDDRIVKAGVKLDDWTRPLTPKPPPSSCSGSRCCPEPRR